MARNRHFRGSVGVVVLLLEEVCLACSKDLSGTIELNTELSRTSGDFDEHHAVDVQRAGADRILKAVNVSGNCPACSAPFSYKAFSVMQVLAREQITPS